MRALVALIVAAMPLLSACGLRDRFASPEDRINRIVPVEPGVQAARQVLLAQAADRPGVRQALERKWAGRLRQRALSCSRDYTPTWRDSDADIRARLVDSTCFADFDRSVHRWIGLQRASLLLGMGPIRPALQGSPALIRHVEFVTDLIAAREAPVVMLQGSSGFDIVELSSGRSLFKEAKAKSVPLQMGLSANARLFTQSASGKVAIRATEGGETLVELPAADGIAWLDKDFLVFRSSSSHGLRLLDLQSGEESSIPGIGDSYAFLVTRCRKHRPASMSSFTAASIKSRSSIKMGAPRPGCEPKPERIQAPPLRSIRVEPRRTEGRGSMGTRECAS